MKVDQSNLMNKYAVDQLNSNKTNKAGKTGKEDENTTPGIPSSDTEDLFQRTLDAHLAGDAAEQVTYMNPKFTMDTAVIENLMKETEGIQSSVSKLINGLLERQGMTIDQLQGGENLSVDEIAREEAAKLIGPGGELSPEKVSDRIVNFSIAAFGGDKSKIDIIRSAIDRGFDEAERMLGGLADVSKDTYELIQEKLDKWVNENEIDTETEVETPAE